MRDDCMGVMQIAKLKSLKETRFFAKKLTLPGTYGIDRNSGPFGSMGRLEF